VLDVSRLDLAKIELREGALQIGALASNTAVAEHAEVMRAAPGLSEALLSGASPQLRNAATVGGNLLQRTRCAYYRDLGTRCNKREPNSGCDAMEGWTRMHAVLGVSDKCIAAHPSDMCVALYALEAMVRVRGPAGGRGHPGGPLRSRRRRYEAVAGAGSRALDAGTAGDPRDLCPRGGDRAAWGGAPPGQRLQGGAGETHRRARPHALRRSAVMSDEIGKPYPRRDGRAKVTGEAVYSYEWPVPGILYGVLVTSNLAKGRISAVDSAAAEREPGVIAVLTPFNAMKLPGGAKPADTGDRVVQVLQDDQILYSNQPVAVAIADTFERALHAAAQVRVSAQPLPFTVRMADELHAA